MRSVETTKTRAIKRIARLEKRQKHYIDRLVYEDIPEKKQQEFKRKVNYLSKLIQTTKNVIKYECRSKK